MGSCDKYESGLMALLDGALGEEARKRLLEHLESCAACRDEYEWLTTTAKDLEAIGNAVVENAPEIDLTEAVMAGLERAPARPRREVAQLPRAWRPWLWTGAGLAAAAALVVACWLGVRWGARSGREAPRQHQARLRTPQAVETGAPTQAPTRDDAQPRHHANQIERADKLLAATKRFTPFDRDGGGRLALPDLAALTVEDVLKARREKAENPAASARLTQWATLSLEDARRICRLPNASIEALIGAAQALPPDEAEALLRAAVGQRPEDPYVRLALATALGAQPEKQQAAEAELAAVSDLDPENALPLYFLAHNWLAAGDVDDGLSALGQARGLPTADAYTPKAAACREQALAEAGMRPDTARLVTALTAGESEYAVLLDLGRALVEQGVQFLTEGDLETAQEVFESVYSMGEQLYEQAEFSLERLAGLDIERSTVDFLEQIYVALGAQEHLEWLSAELDAFFGQIEELTGFFEALNGLFLDLMMEGYEEAIAKIILESGDLGLFEEFLSPAGATAQDTPQR